MAVAPASRRPRPGGSRLFIIVGLVIALFAFGAVFVLGNTVGNGGGGAAKTTVVIARQAIPLRHVITKDDLDTELVTGNFTSANNIYTNINDLINKVSEIQITKGSIITSDMVAIDIGVVPQGLAPAYLPLASGYVAMTIPTGEEQGVAGNISLGDYITVLVSAPESLFGATTSKVVTKTVFTNVYIIGLGPRASSVQSANSGSSGTGSATTTGVTSSLTIELTQCDAEYMTWFLNNTTVRYTLESYHDYLQQPSEPDPSCPTVLAARGVSNSQVDARFHFTAL